MILVLDMDPPDAAGAAAGENATEPDPPRATPTFERDERARQRATAASERRGVRGRGQRGESGGTGGRALGEQPDLRRDARMTGRQRVELVERHLRRMMLLERVEDAGVAGPLPQRRVQELLLGGGVHRQLAHERLHGLRLSRHVAGVFRALELLEQLLDLTVIAQDELDGVHVLAPGEWGGALTLCITTARVNERAAACPGGEAAAAAANGGVERLDRRAARARPFLGGEHLVCW
ncbi:MAG TPA: hypothetical protein VIV57_17870 [Anaeromyxobacter sp.]